MTKNERFKKRVKKFAAQHNMRPAQAARVLREQHAQRHTSADQQFGHTDVHHVEEQATSPAADPSTARADGQNASAEQQAIVQAVLAERPSLTCGSDGKTETTFYLTAIYNCGDAPRTYYLTSPPRIMLTGLVKGGRGESEASERFAEANEGDQPVLAGSD